MIKYVDSAAGRREVGEVERREGRWRRDYERACVARFLPEGVKSTYSPIDFADRRFAYPQFFARILQVFEYRMPSLPQAGLAPRQHDSRQCLVVWQCFLFVRTTPWLRTGKEKKQRKRQVEIAFVARLVLC